MAKGANYNCKLVETLQDHSCRISCDQGGEWSRLPRAFSDVRTVNHSIEWVTYDGQTTSLGECFNGHLKGLGRKLNLFKGNGMDSDFNDRWHELAFRSTIGMQRADLPSGGLSFRLSQSAC
eukprot:7620988-Pyramimonas_sp.AAC.1